MKWIGITGGIATGKSQVATFIREKGFVVLDADSIARNALSPDTEVYSKVLSEFGNQVLAPDGIQVDREILANIVFKNKERLSLLESLIHPFVKEYVEKEKERLKSDGHSILFYDVPLLFEKNMEKDFDTIILVAASEINQVERMKKRNQWSEPQISLRIKSQMPLSDKIQKSNFVIHNEGSLESLKEKVSQVLGRLAKPSINNSGL